MPATANLGHISIVLQRPRYPENIGAAVRAMSNMGIGQLVVVQPENYDLEKIMMMATHATTDAVNRIRLFDDLKTALAPFEYVIGTTARLGKQRRDILSPSQMAAKLIPITSQNNVAVLFGPEDRGLSNEDIRYCHDLVNIPTAEFSSLNLAQAVMVLCYEIFTASTIRHESFTPRLAGRFELDNMYDHLTDVLTRISFLNPTNPDYWLNNLRSLFSRMQLRAKDVAIIRGICRQIDWYAEKRYRDGLEEGKIALRKTGKKPSNQ